MKTLFIIISIFSFIPYSYTQENKITFTAPGLYPEGTAWSAGQRSFYVSSATTGTISKINAAGVYSPFYTDTLLKSSFGMKTDEKNAVLWVATGDPNYSRYSSPATFQKAGRIIGIDLNTGKKKFDIDLAKLFTGRHFINDLSLDSEGNIYATDSYSPVIYKITKTGQAFVFLQHNLFSGKDIGLNGIVVHPKGFLLLVNNEKGTILKVNLANPADVKVVQVNHFFPGADGLLLDEKQNLLLVQNKGVDRVYRLSSIDNWNTAQITGVTAVEDRFQNPTTLTDSGGKLYVLNAKLNEITDSTKAPSKEFSLQHVNFRAVN